MEIKIKLDIYENAFHHPVAHYKKGDVHMTVTPHLVGAGADTMNGYEVFFWGDKDGKPNTAKVLESSTVDGGPDDLEEIADTFARRLEMGVKPEEMFRDIEEANRESMLRAYEELKKK